MVRGRNGGGERNEEIFGVRHGELKQGDPNIMQVPKLYDKATLQRAMDTGLMVTIMVLLFGKLWSWAVTVGGGRRRSNTRYGNLDNLQSTGYYIVHTFQ